MATNYFITGIWQNDEKVLTRVLLHEINQDGGWNHGVSKTINEVVALINGGSSIRVKKWSYQAADWTTGPQVIVSKTKDGTPYIKTSPDHIVSDNLEHLIRMHAIA